MTAIRDIEDAYIRRLTEMKDPLEQFDYLMAQKGSLENGYVFNREEANAR